MKIKIAFNLINKLCHTKNISVNLKGKLNEKKIIKIKFINVIKNNFDL